jgi:hypothetical protein
MLFRDAIVLSVLVGMIPALALGQVPQPMIPEPADFRLQDEGAEPEEEDEIETDRDSFTPATTTVGRSRWVIESAYTFLDNRRVPETHSFPELVMRYGVTDWLELRMGANYEVGGAGNPVSANVPDDPEDEPGLEEEATVSYGLKAALTNQNGWVPQSVVILQAFTPTSGKSTDTHLALTYAGGWTLPNGWVWDTAFRYATGSAEEDRFNVWCPSTVIKIPLGERWKVHLEYFGIFSQGRAKETTQHFISPGAHYLITSDWEVGARFGWGLNDQSPNFFVNVGGGYRF